MNHRSIRIALAVLVTVIAVASINYRQFIEIESAFSAGYYKMAAVRGGVLVVLTLCLFGLGVFGHRLVHWFLLAIIAFSFMTNAIYRQITGMSLTAENVEWLLSEVANLSNAFAEFRSQFLIGAAMTVGPVALLLLARRLGRPSLLGICGARWGRALAVAGPLSFCVLETALAVRAPVNTTWEANIPGFVGNFLARDVPAPAAVAESPVTAGALKVVIVVDESMQGSVFRGSLRDNLLKHGASELAPATTAIPCSAGSNALIRWGVNPRHDETASNDARANPTVFGYAHRAGYTTTLLDAQSKGPPQNFMTVGERSLIDHFIPLNRGIDSDHDLARWLNAELRRPGRSFIYAVKRGAHFPYDSNYPVSQALARLDRMGQYRQAIQYSNRTFFDEVLAGVDMSSVLMIYTSDHGQELTGKKLPHCNPVPSASELEVPLWVFGGGDYARSLAKAAREKSAGAEGYSTLQIFPTAVIAMGFDAGAIESRYYLSMRQRVAERWLVPHPYLPYPTANVKVVRFNNYVPAG